MLLAALILSSVAHAGPTNYFVKSELKINGETVSTAKMITPDGVQADVQQKDKGLETFIAVTPSEGQGQIKGKKAILMKFVVGVVENGERKILGQPQIMVAEDSTAEVTLDKPGSKDSILLKVVAERQ